MPTILAQAAGATVTDIAWSAFAPELVLGGTSLVLLLLVVAGRRRMWLAAPIGLAVAVLGVLLVPTQGFVGPLLIAVGVLLVAVVIGLGGSPRLVSTGVSILGAGAALLLTMWQAAVLLLGEGGGPEIVMGGSVALDGIAVFTRITVYLAVLLVLPLSTGYLRDRNIARAEFEPLLLLSATGMGLLGAASDAITLFVALEILSISLYVLSGLARRDRRSQESAVKYFVIGSVASAILLYGLALLYAATGELTLPGIGAAMTLVTTPLPMVLAGIGLVTVGIGFKVSMAPFQLWTPDVYQGAPTNVTAFMAAGTKAAGFAALLRLYLVAFGPLDHLWTPVLATLAALTMLYGAIVAIVQRDLKRILAYSSIAHAGYALIGVVSGTGQGVSATVWYLLTYSVSTIAAFAVVVALERQRGGEVTLLDIRGLGRSSPMLAAVLGLALVSLAGIPPTAGFAGKLVVFQAGIDAGYAWLVVIGVLSTVIAAFFYLRVAGTMFLEEPAQGAVEPPLSLGLMTSTSLAAAFVVFLGLQPQVLLSLAERTAAIAQ